ncbi:MAG: dienelactone hydrolase family protein [Actinomycetota bacterium]|nr:dienelactone hydrolase family protein [Actinomycetota bacterium]
MQRFSIDKGDVIGAVYQPDHGSTGCAVVLGGSGGGVPDRLAQRVARTGVTAFGLAYFGARGLSPALEEVPLERLQRAIDLFRRRYGHRRPVGLVGSSKGAELALCLASRVGDLIGPVIAVSPSSVSWYGLHGSGRPSMQRPSWTWGGSPVPFLPFLHGATPSFSPDAGLRVDSCYEPSRYPREQVDAARLPVEMAVGPILILAGDDDHMWPSAPMAAQITDRLHTHGRDGDVCSVVYQGAGHTFLHHDPEPRAVPTRSRWDFGGSPAADAEACHDAWKRIAAFLQAG